MHTSEMLPFGISYTAQFCDILSTISSLAAHLHTRLSHNDGIKSRSCRELSTACNNLNRLLPLNLFIVHPLTQPQHLSIRKSDNHVVFHDPVSPAESLLGASKLTEQSPQRLARRPGMLHSPTVYCKRELMNTVNPCRRRPSSLYSIRT
jgi:hypothetical protein